MQECLLILYVRFLCKCDEYIYIYIFRINCNFEFVKKLNNFKNLDKMKKKTRKNIHCGKKNHSLNNSI